MIRFIVKLFCYLPFKLLFWTKWINKRELKRFRGQPVILAMQHRTACDAPIIVVDVWRKTDFWAKGDLLRSRFGKWFFKGLGCIPVSAGSELALLRDSQKVLAANHALVVMPQGHRSFNQNDQLQIHNGIAMVALRTGVPIIPIVTDRPSRIFRLTKLKVGTAIDSRQFLQDGRMTKDGMHALSAALQQQMQTMLVDFAKPVKLPAWQTAPNLIGRGIVIRDGKILAIERHRDNEDFYVLPGGHLEAGETLAQGCEREVLEETGVVATPYRELYKYWYIDHKHHRGDGWQTFMVCEYQNGEPHQTDAEEYTDPERKGGSYNPVWLDLEQVKNVDLRPAVMKKQLLKDYHKKGARLSFPLRRLKGMKKVTPKK